MYPQVFGKYVLEGELARGGMARLLLATLRGAGGFEKKLVVKQIRDELASDEDFVRRFVEEAKTTVALSHPNIVPVYELGVEQGTYFLAMELVVGVSISELLEGGVLTPEQGAYVGVEVCRALDYAHRRMQVVHRDITPRNVMVDEEGQVKLIDFGIASLARTSGDQQVFGSPGHMPPEQMAGKPVGPPADLFALGVLLIEAWSKKAPFRRKTPDEVDAALRGPRTKPSDIDVRLLPLDDMMAKTLSSEASERPQEAEELGRTLRRFLSGIDLGDVARELGDRVRERRIAIRAKKEAPSSAKPGLQRPASRGEMITKTFAARTEVKAWSEHPQAMAHDEAGPSTRKVESVSEKPKDKSDNIETIATRPIETPASPKAEPPRRSTVPFVAVAAVVALAAGGAYFARAKRTSSPALAATESPGAASSAPSAAAPIATQTPSVAVVAKTETPIAPQSPASSAAETRALGHFALYGDPGTRAFVDGAPRGNCPVADVTIEPGPHEIRFIFDATGESSGTRVTVKSGERIRFRADFTGATPTIRKLE